ncbi:MAG: GerAB/ArcD/ProY family transporter [Firmicutes bacterium]|nr:GerAB/ArcD/ProY family transporter [Bacillota bacterium]
MIKEGHIGPAEAMVLIMTMITAKVFLSFPQVMVEVGKTAGWLVIIVSGVGGLLGFSVLIQLLKRFPQLNIIAIGEEVAGPVVGLVSALAYAGFFYVWFIITVREFAELVITTTLPEAPLSVVLLMLISTSLAAAYFGLENIARTAHVLYPFLFFSLGFILVLLIPFWKGDYLFPLLGSGPREIIKTGLLKSANFSEVFFLTLILPSLGNWRKLQSIGFKPYLLL